MRGNLAAFGAGIKATLLIVPLVAVVAVWALAFYPATVFHFLLWVQTVNPFR